MSKKPLLRSELIAQLASEFPDLGREEILHLFKESVQFLQREMRDEGKEIHFRNFGSFRAKSYGPRTIYNPKRGELVTTDRLESVRFRLSDALRKRMPPL